MNIRPADECDAEATVTFLRHYRGEGLRTILQQDGTPTLEDQRAFIRSHDGMTSVMLLCVKDGRVVGSLTAQAKRHSQLSHSCEFGMGVLMEERGKGIGTALIYRLGEWAKSTGVVRLELCVFARNAGAIRLYQRLGFRIEGVKVAALKIGDAYEDIIEMAKTA